MILNLLGVFEGAATSRPRRAGPLRKAAEPGPTIVQSEAANQAK